ncbi:MAG: extracellular solute-binding protein [Hyphomicrobiaceae bacterium]|nr:extracellular solute-binding protein [Hyphomicrobiaceae bacterium]
MPVTSTTYLRGMARALLVACLCVFLTAGANAGERRHGLSTFGDLKYPADFKHFEYVNPAAPKGGKLSMIGTAGLITFNTLNGYILKGDPAQGLTYLFDSLMTAAQDEPGSMYGLVAESAELADNKRSVTFYLRPEAKFSDGTPVTAEDIVNSFTLLKEKGHPFYALRLRDVEKAEAIDPGTVRYTFTGDQIRDLPIIVSGLPIFSKAYYDKNDFTKTTLKPPLGSGPYKIKNFKQGSFIVYERREDYWGKDLPVNQGRFNFDELRYEYFRDRTAQFEALKAGEYDLREEFTSKTWATEYDIPQVKSGKLIRLTLPDERPSGAQGFFINTRRDKFKDPRVRKALDHAFDFEWTNRNQFYGLYKRTNSFFENSDMKASGPPSEGELALLAPHRDKLPKEVFDTPYSSPVSNGSGQDRKLLRAASKLLKEAGWTVKDGKRVNAKGERLDIEFLIFSPTFERIIAPFVKNLKILGIDARIRLVDPSQYQERVKSFDFDITTQRYVMNATPGVELRNYWGTQAADTSGSQNLAGIKDPVIDALIEKVVAAKSRDELVTATRAIDRVLRARYYWVPHWYKAAHNIAHWNRFSRPETKPKYARGVIETWWYDEAKAAKLAANN